jgi:hypothetical protein
LNPEQSYSLLKGLGKYQGKQLPPIHLWHPDESRQIDMKIDRKLEWYYQGTPIKRQSMVRLFSNVLRREEDDEYYLVTPVEKCQIEVEDVPFEAILLDIEGQGCSQSLRFTTNVADEIDLDSQHPLRIEVDPTTEEPSPYILVRDRLEARLARSVYYQLVELAVPHKIDNSEWFGVWSHGEFFKLMKT